MDINRTYHAATEAAVAINRAREAGLTPDEGWSFDMAEHVEVLDQHIRNTGELPKKWQDAVDARSRESTVRSLPRRGPRRQAVSDKQLALDLEQRHCA
jgi:hypothetical protein